MRERKNQSNVFSPITEQYNHMHDGRCGAIETVAWTSGKPVSDNGNVGRVRLGHVFGHRIYWHQFGCTVSHDK